MEIFKNLISNSKKEDLNLLCENVFDLINENNDEKNLSDLKKKLSLYLSANYERK